MFRSGLLLVLALLAGTLFVGGCGELPRPFKTWDEEDRRNNRLLAIRAGRGVQVVPAGGAADESISRRLAAVLTERLHDQDVLASMDEEPPKAFILDGLLNYDQGTVIYAWVLRDREDLTWGKGIVETRVDYLDWLQGSDRLTEQLAGRASAAVARVLKPATFEAAGKAAEIREAKVAVTAVSGAPGDGNLALIRSLKNHLRAAKVPFTEDSGRAAVHLAGLVAARDLGDGRDEISLTWIFSYPDGEEIARISQANPVPHGALDDRWGDAAYDATIVLVDAVRQVLALLHESGSAVQ